MNNQESGGNQMGARKYLHLTAINISKGVITLIEPNGTVGVYAQRGIDKLSNDEFMRLVRSGRLDSRVMELPKLPSNYCISFEDEETMGKAKPSFKI